MKPIKILLAQGHGAGKKYNRGGLYFNEGDNNYYYSLILKEELEKYDGITVDLLRNKITDNPTLKQRSYMGKGYDLYLAIHSNATNKSSVRGTEVWDSVEKPNKKLAQALCDATAKLFNHNNRGVRYKEGRKGWNWYGELRGNQAKFAMIVENGFHTNPQDCRFFKDNHQKLAEIQAKVIADYYGLKKKSITDNTPSNWAKNNWEWAKNEKWLDGNRPKGELTREELASVLARLYNNIK
jgi:N-acetylmuramoyl-L-alanine amidase